MENNSQKAKSFMTDSWKKKTENSLAVVKSLQNRQYSLEEMREQTRLKTQAFPGRKLNSKLKPS
jgi:hypothetical protein